MKVSELTGEQKRTIAGEIVWTCESNSDTANELGLDSEQVDEILAECEVSACELCSWYFDEGELGDWKTGRFLCEECRADEE